MSDNIEPSDGMRAFLQSLGIPPENIVMMGGDELQQRAEAGKALVHTLIEGLNDEQLLSLVTVMRTFKAYGEMPYPAHEFYGALVHEQWHRNTTPQAAAQCSST